MTDFDLTLLNKFVLHCNIHSEKLIAELRQCITGSFSVINSSPVALVELELSAEDLTLTAFPKDSANLEVYSIQLFESCSFGSFVANRQFIKDNSGLLEEIFAKWIANCWQKAGGLVYRTPVYIICKNSGRRIELMTNKAVFNPIVL